MSGKRDLKSRRRRELFNEFAGLSAKAARPFRSASRHLPLGSVWLLLIPLGRGTRVEPSSGGVGAQPALVRPALPSVNSHGGLRPSLTGHRLTKSARCYPRTSFRSASPVHHTAWNRPDNVEEMAVLPRQALENSTQGLNRITDTGIFSSRGRVAKSARREREAGCIAGASPGAGRAVT